MTRIRADFRLQRGGFGLEVALDLPDRGVSAIFGPSGCGKTTLLRMIAGLEDISGGTLSIAGQTVNDLPPAERGVAMVFQSYALYPHKTVYDNMAFGLKIAKVPKPEIDRRVREASEILQLNDYLQRLPKALSGGQRQRVAIGRGIVRNPQVFLSWLALLVFGVIGDPRHDGGTLACPASPAHPATGHPR